MPILTQISLYARHCGQPTLKQKCNLFQDGLSAYMCAQCNWVQIDEERLIVHVKQQHGITTAIQNAYQNITIIPALNAVHTQQPDPRNILVQGIIG